MDWLPALVEKASSLYGVIILLIIMIVGYILLRTGKLQIKTKAVQLGKADIEENERKIMRQQMSFLHVSAEGLTTDFTMNCGDVWRAKYVISKMCDVLEEAILYNHIIRGDEKYVAIKQKLVFNAVLKRMEDPYFSSEEFKELCDKFTRDMLTEFINIREVYKG
jgi:hypothetical protein